MLKYSFKVPQKRYLTYIHQPDFISLHWHDFYEIEWIIEGTGTQIINSVEVSLSPGALTFVAPTDFHRLECNTQENFKILNIQIQPDALSEDLRSIFRIYPPPYFITLDEEQQKKYTDTYYELKNLINNPNELNDAIACRKVETMLLELVLLSQKKPLPLPQNQRLSNAFQPVIKYINEHYSEPLRREQLAALVHMSPSYFSYQFKKSLRIPLFRYITDVRLQKAYSILKQTDEPIHNVVTSVGFNSLSLFYRKFYEYYGIRPSDVKRK